MYIKGSTIFPSVIYSFVALHGTSQAKLLAQFWGRYHPRWKNAVQKLLHFIVRRFTVYR